MTAAYMTKPPPLSLLLPRPPSVNQLYVNNPHTRGRFSSAAYKAWKTQAELALLQQRFHLTPGPVEVRIRVGRKNRQRADCANFEKATSDFLVTHRLIEDDCLIQRNTQEWCTGLDGIEVTILPLDGLL